MNSETKIKIIEAAKRYMDDHKHEGMSQIKLSALASLNNAYLNTLMNGKFSIGTGGKLSEIKDKVFIKLADAIGFKILKSYWEPVATPEFKQTIVTLKEAKLSGRVAMLIGETGCGKTFTTDKFVMQNPVHTFRVTASAVYNLNDLLYDLLNKLGLEVNGTKARRLARVANKLNDISISGGNPILIIDEGENLKQPAFQMVKALYDGVKNHCSIVLIGTSQLYNKIEKMRIKNKEGMPQLARRFKAGTIFLPEMDKSFKLFIEKYNFDSSFKKLLLELCDNYGELNDYIEPFLREADLRNEQPTEELFRRMYHIPTRLRRA